MKKEKRANESRRTGIEGFSVEGTPMPGRYRIDILLLCAMVWLVTSCDQDKRDAEAIAVEEIPPALQTISDRAESIIVAVPAQDWSRVYAYIRDINDTWQGYRVPTIRPSPEPRRYPAGMLFSQLDADLAKLRDAAIVRDAGRTMRAANDLSGTAGELMGYYNPARPSGIHRLSVLERQIVIESADGTLAEASRSLSSVRTVWRRTRQTIRERAGDTIVREFDQLITDQQMALEAQNPNQLATSARSALKMLNEMQQLQYAGARGRIYAW